MALLVIVASFVAAQFDLVVIHPGTGEEIRPVNLMSLAGLHRILTQMVTNFTSFAPLGTVLVAMLGIGIAEGSGLIGAALRLLVISAPKRLLTFVLVLAGVLSNTASEIGYVLLVPLAAAIFLAAGRHPIAGLAAAFAGVSGGYSANLLLGTIDPLLAGLSEEAAAIVDPGYQVNPAANYYFMAVSVPFIALVGTWVTEKVVVPRLGEYTGDEKPEELRDLTPEERRGLRWAWRRPPPDGAPGLVRAPRGLRSRRRLAPGPGHGQPPPLPVHVGDRGHDLHRGRRARDRVRRSPREPTPSDSQVMAGMGKAMETLGLYMVLVFFAAQFVAYFNWTNLGLIVAVKGAELLSASGLGPIPLLLSFVLVAGFINLFMGSASAKWAIMAPVFIPMLMLLGYSPELTQTAYRIGDSTTNIISPMMTYFALIVAFVERYDRKAGIGTVIATMLPYTVAFMLVWMVLLVVFVVFGIPWGRARPSTSRCRERAEYRPTRSRRRTRSGSPDSQHHCRR
jgi:aminobenzoyl-glutamate transport protein